MAEITAAREFGMWLRHNGLRSALDVGVNLLLPVLVFNLLLPKHGEINALLASSGPPLLWSLGEFAWTRRVDALAMIVLAGIVLSLLAFLGGGSARLLEVKEKLVTVLIAVAFLGSAAINKPLIYPLAVATIARRSQAGADEFIAKRDQANVRQTIMVLTLVWGFGLLADGAISIALVFMLSVHDYLIIGPTLGYAAVGLLLLWTIWFRRHRELDLPR